MRQGSDTKHWAVWNTEGGGAAASAAGTLQDQGSRFSQAPNTRGKKKTMVTKKRVLRASCFPDVALYYSHSVLDFAVLLLLCVLLLDLELGAVDDHLLLKVKVVLGLDVDLVGLLVGLLQDEVGHLPDLVRRSLVHGCCCCCCCSHSLAGAAPKTNLVSFGRGGGRGAGCVFVRYFSRY